MSAAQVDRILAYFCRQNRGLTSHEAIILFGCHRLAARIYDLRRRGYCIYAQRDPSGLARYQAGAKGRRK